MPFKDVLKAAEGKIDIKKLKGPGICYDVQGLPESVLLRFIVQSRTRVETYVKLSGVEQAHVSSFASMCCAAKQATGKAMPNPPYPRPEAHTLSELIQVFIQLKNLALAFDNAIK